MLAAAEVPELKCESLITVPAVVVVPVWLLSVAMILLPAVTAV